METEATLVTKDNRKDLYRRMYGIEMPELKDRRYLVVVRKFEYISSASVPVSGQIATDSKWFAKSLYRILDRMSYKNYGSFSVMLFERNSDGTYNAIER